MLEIPKFLRLGYHLIRWNLEKFSIETNESTNLFKEIEELDISDALQYYLEYNVPLATKIATEKAKSELIIAPVLVEAKRRIGESVSLFSGTPLDVDKENGLSGICDFIISRSHEQLYLTCPIVAVVEPKNDNILTGIGQCASEMVAIQKFNKNENAVFGVVSTGTTWQFMKLQHKTLFIDSMEYYINQVEKIVGILVNIVTNET